MYKYKIGIVDEDPCDMDFIERTVLENKPDNVSEEQIDFWRCPFPTESENVYDSIVKLIIEKITKEEIQALIVDYKIIISAKSLEGALIFKRLVEIVPKFPLVMLSNVPNECYEKEFIDADKVYSKKEFFKLEEDYSIEKVRNIFRNIDKYDSQRSKLSTQLAAQLNRLESNEYAPEILQSVIETEKLLDDFVPQQETTVEKTLKVADLKNVVELLEEANKLIGGGDEN